ncbi:MAG: hypothetical protein ABI425_05610 [Patescibacteria group bacterium]
MTLENQDLTPDLHSKLVDMSTQTEVDLNNENQVPQEALILAHDAAAAVDAFFETLRQAQ